MATWSTFESEMPAGAAAFRDLVRQHTIVYLATTRRDGSSQVHPVAPYFSGEGLYVFVVSMSTKMGDLDRDGRFAFHTLPGTENNPEVLLSGAAFRVDEPAIRERVAVDSGYPHHDWEVLFEFQPTKCLYTTWADWGGSNPWPSFERWKEGQPPEKVGPLRSADEPPPA